VILGESGAVEFLRVKASPQYGRVVNQSLYDGEVVRFCNRDSLDSHFPGHQVARRIDGIQSARSVCGMWVLR